MVRKGSVTRRELIEKGISEKKASECIYVLAYLNDNKGRGTVSGLENYLKNMGSTIRPSDISNFLRTLEYFGYIKYSPKDVGYEITKKGKFG